MSRRKREFVTHRRGAEGLTSAELEACAYARIALAARLAHAMQAAERQGLLARDRGEGGTEEGRSPVSSGDADRFFDAVHPRTEEVGHG